MIKRFLQTTFLIATILSCSEIDKLTQFNMRYSSTVTIPSSSIVSLPINLDTPDINSNSESTFSGNNTRKDLIEEIRLTEMTLTISSPTDGTFSFLEAISISISANGLPDNEIAFLNNIPDNGSNTITLDVSDDDIKEYLTQDKFKLKVSTTTDETIEQDHDIEINSTFFVDAKILGQ
ncbi:hypothetical protein [Reichenbachiella sp.]|uniref:hypothetical protein n=1 Tax=Reichenbachiella sp. TaxID=2184521 RepID=UPI003BB12B50